MQVVQERTRKEKSLVNLDTSLGSLTSFFLISHFQGYQQNLKGALVLVFLYHTMSLCLFSFSLPTF